MGTHSPRKGISFEDALQARQAQAQDALQERELQHIARRTAEAEKAKEFGRLRRLHKNSTARRFADAILEEFPQHRPPTDGSPFTEPAQVAALDKMSDKDVLDEKGLTLGYEVARAALSWARSQLRKAPAAKSSKQSEDATQS